MNLSHPLPSTSAVQVSDRLATARAALARGGRAVWRVLEAFGRSRASADMLRVADQLQSTHPAAAARLRAAARRHRA